ncbi:ATP-dependent DNA helicase RecG [Paenibacillus thermoaerophilus]|uniref:ATP-dependent DNA helicase RecG n=1 Tax=Paenibacillus thermoaerophilus TaxID=1215385 RepID=A0ABW2V1C4_9BACL|nr:ATP-dependent DNA helicase RecG [Paenibacillus thermoaerophilus]TMV19162.1 ATP-dependent DNA helicase RecG [Paenibacillus thermoaerophilus]
MAVPEASAVKVASLKGIGPQRAEDLRALGIETVEDLLLHFPFRYEDYRLRDPSELKNGEKATMRVKLVSAPLLHMTGRNKSRMTARVMAGPLMATAVWFNRHFLKDRLIPGTELVLTGKWEARRLQLTVFETEFPDSGPSQAGTLQPVYHVAGSLNQRWMRKAIESALERYGAGLDEFLPESLRLRHHLMPRLEAVRAMHRPDGTRKGAEARQRLVYEELFRFQLKLHAYRAIQRSRQQGTAHVFERERVREFVRSLPFALTNAQKRVIAEILRDLEQPYAMNRLLQGDVGAGKTVVAAIAFYAVALAGRQGALMAPTEILAEQHVRSLEKLLAPHGLRVGLLTGSLTEKRRREIKAEIADGSVHIVVGTHALIQEDVAFRDLGLVVTDEQHRFGVEQRSTLRRKGGAPDILMMTATPIPRTLAITAFGDLDVSTLDELPRGRKPVKTYWVKPDMLDRVIGFIRRETAAGRQAYVICPLIEESDKLDVQNAIDVHMQLTQALPGLRIGLLHGRMTPGEKDAAMRRFAANEDQVLVSTTVVEVGVDVPNATLMVVYDAERFGLSQLHQLRGRVGRGEHQSYCVLIADPKSDTGKERMQAMIETNDGFEISRRDLELRGPGDFFGTKQSGIPDFKLADLSADFEWMEKARDDAARLVASEEFWTDAAYLPLRHWLQREGVLQGEWMD